MLVGIKRSQDPGNHALLVRVPDANLQAVEFLSPQAGNDALDPVVAARLAAGPDPQLGDWHIHVVVDNQDVAGVDLEELGRRATALPDSFM